MNELFQTIRQFGTIPDRMRTREEIDSRMGVGVYEKTPMTATKSQKFSQKQKAYYLSRRYTMWIIQESILEFKLRYGLERLFNTPTLKSIYKSFIAMIKCFIYLIKPHKTDNIF